MFLVIELLFIALLISILFMLYRNEYLAAKRFQPRGVIKEYWSGRERRNHVRFKKALDVNYFIKKKPHLRNNCKTIDISEGGMKLLLDEKLAPKTILTLKVSLPGSKKHAEIEGSVVWSDEAPEQTADKKRLFYTGIQFFAINEPPGSTILDYVRSLPAEEGE